MSSSAKSNWCKMRQRNTLGRVGEFYEYVVAALLEGQVAEEWDFEHADVFNENLSVRVEVKARDNNHAFGIGIHQKRGYEESIPFPLSHTLYALVTFRNSKRTRRSDRRPRGLKSDTFSELARLSHKSEQQNFLAEKIDEVFLLDLKIVNALERFHGTRKDHFAGDGRNEEVAVLRRTELRKYFLNGSFTKSMREFGLKPSQWVRKSQIVQVPMTLKETSFNPEFVLVTVLRPSLHKKIAQVIRDKVLTPK